MKSHLLAFLELHISVHVKSVHVQHGSGNHRFSEASHLTLNSDIFWGPAARKKVSETLSFPFLHPHAAHESSYAGLVPV